MAEYIINFTPRTIQSLEKIVQGASAFIDLINIKNPTETAKGETRLSAYDSHRLEVKITFKNGAHFFWMPLPTFKEINDAARLSVTLNNSQK